MEEEEEEEEERRHLLYFDLGGGGGGGDNGDEAKEADSLIDLSSELVSIYPTFWCRYNIIRKGPDLPYYG
jgi:hypothetical protein